MKKFWLVALAASGALLLSACSLFTVDDDGDADDELTAASITTLVPATVTVASAPADTPPTTFELLAELEALYEIYGITGTPTFENDVWVFTGVAPDENVLAEFLGSARRLEGVNVTRSLIELAPAGEVAAPPTVEGEAAANEETAPPASGPAADPGSETAGPVEEAETLPLTGPGLSVILSIAAMLLIAMGAFAVATGKHIWLKTQLTNAFRPEPSRTSIFEVERRRRGRGRR